MNDIETAAPAPLPIGRFDGRQAFIERIRLALAMAAHEGWPSLMLSDPDFLDWPLCERAVIETLGQWASRGRQIRLLARDFGPLRLAHPRLVQWRTTWSHRVEAHACPGASGSELPSAFWSPGWTLERLDLVRSIGVSSQEPERRIALLERLDACWHKGSVSFPATILGL